MTAASRLRRQRRDWEELAGFNPEWAILPDPDARFASWDMEEFFASGERRVEKMMRVAADLGLPESNRAVLDFGCGVGRLSRALSGHFQRYVGIDISSRMIARAEELNAHLPNCTFVVNDSPGLERFGDGEFDAVVSYLVLQHIPDRDLIRRYLVELARVLAPGGLLAMQLPSAIPLLYRLAWRRRLYRLLRALGVGVEHLHRLGLHNMALQALPEAEVTTALASAGCVVLRIEGKRRRHGRIPLLGGVSSKYYASKA
jgi:SAM-dependent methyltransferase